MRFKLARNLAGDMARRVTGVPSNAGLVGAAAPASAGSGEKARAAGRRGARFWPSGVSFSVLAEVLLVMLPSAKRGRGSLAFGGCGAWR